ncbi:hypothetical protein BaRGS_00040565 [Batillaria attramentaria]|uniref:Uncharacterized protein n=1 Tax=Batillaria attramentaria TaxID=370345 RepID=A0ABD0IZT2_9CAEN
MGNMRWILVSLGALAVLLSAIPPGECDSPLPEELRSDTSVPEYSLRVPTRRRECATGGDWRCWSPCACGQEPQEDQPVLLSSKRQIRPTTFCSKTFRP